MVPGATARGTTMAEASEQARLDGDTRAITPTPGWSVLTGRTGAGRLRRAAQAIALPVLLLALWQVLAGLGLLPPFLVSPLAIAAQFLALLGSGELLLHARDSLYRSLAGFGLGAFFGIGLGLLSGVSRRVEHFFDPLISLTYPVPKIAVLPVLIVWFGISDTSKILVIMLSCFYPCFIAALYGVRAVDPAWVWAARNMGARPRQVFLKVIVPAAAPQVFTGLRVALALAFILMFSSEMIGSSNRTGLGFLILSADAAGRFDQVFAAVLAIALLGFAADRLLLWLRGRLLVGQLIGEAQRE
jgi:ABC-type nitrate/sulfonate/bicarbonate transport system permease component